VDETLVCDHPNVKAIEQYFHVILIIMLYKVVKSVDETLVCSHLDESYWAMISCGTVCYAVQGGPNFNICEWNPSAWPFKWKSINENLLNK